MLKIIKDKDPIWDTDKFDVILIGTSIYNQLNGGFQSKMKYKYPMVDEKNRETKYADFSKLGTRITINNTPIISLMYICGYPRPNIDTVDYDSLTKCLLTANAEFRGKKVMATILGSSQFDGNGDKDKCLKIIEDSTKDLDITLYDYEQKKRADEIREQKMYLKSLQYTDIEKYNKLKNVFDLYLKKLYLNGYKNSEKRKNHCTRK